MARPLIGITGPTRQAIGPRSLVAMAIRLYGGRPLQLHPGQQVEDFPLQGIVITGGHDIDPVLYAAEPEVHPHHDKERDRFESAAIAYALKHHLPLLGICRGAQLLNVIRGGSLFQDLRPHRRETSHRRTILPVKTLLLEPHSRLASWMNCRQCHINSLHDQAIDRLGEGLVVAACDRDGIVQAVEDPRHPFLLGVQWHPEFLPYLPRHLGLFGALVRVARGQKKP